MSAFVLLLIGIAALTHTTWNLVVKHSGNGGPLVLWLSFAVGSVVYAPFGVASLVESGAGLGLWLLLAAGSGALEVVYFMLLQRGYTKADVSVVYPAARGSAPVLSVVFAIVLLGERPSAPALLGALVVVAGVLVISLGGSPTLWRTVRARARKQREQFAGPRPSTLPIPLPASSSRVRKGVVYGLVTGVVIASYTLWDAWAVTAGGLPPVGLYWGSVVFQLGWMTPVVFRARTGLRETVRRHGLSSLAIGVLSPLGYILVLVAVQQAGVALVAPAREGSVVLVGIAGWLIFKEPHPAQRLVGAAIVLGGVALLSVG